LEADGEEPVAAVGVADGAEGEACVEGGFEVIAEGEAGACADAEEVEDVLLFGERVVERDACGVDEGMEAPVGAGGGGFCQEGRTSEFERGGDGGVAEGGGFEVAADRAEAAGAELFVVDERVVGELALDAGVELGASGELVGVGDVGAEVDEAAVGEVAFGVEGGGIAAGAAEAEG